MTFPSTDQLFREDKDSTTQLKITRQLVMLHAASRNISATLESQQVSEIIVEEFANLLSASACFLWMWAEDGNKLEFVADHHANTLAKFPRKNIAKPNSIFNTHPELTEKVLTRRNVLHISKETPGADEEFLEAMEANHIASLLLLPLIAHNSQIGFIEVLLATESPSRRPYETYEIVIARLLANQSAISIENARLFESAKQEIQARKITEEKLRYHALHDVLTNLPNRVLFLDRLDQAILRYKRFLNLEYAVLFIDLDRFKNINDSFGHLEGDRALREVAKRLSASIREGDTVCRFGGDEFLILLEGELNSVTVKEITDRIQSDLSKPLLVSGHEFQLTASIGVAVGMEENADKHDYIRNANLAMYQAKAKGGGRAEIFSPTKGLELKSKVILETAIREAARKKTFTLNYQPIYDLETLSIAGLEVLLRWEKDNYAIGPSTFIPLLENIGLMPELGLWILETAIHNYQNWKEFNRSISNLSLSVNISNAQIVQEDFLAHLKRILKETEMDPTKLNLEITEHVLIDDLELANKRVRAMHAMGVNVHLDDFGTGYSSLAHLSELPVQALKIDKQFVQQINPAEMEQGLVLSILAMARKFNVRVIAEGIETEKQLRGLRFAECKYGQGHFLSPALTENKLLALLRTSPFIS